jgi:hypothetical protein
MTSRYAPFAAVAFLLATLAVVPGCATGPPRTLFPIAPPLGVAPLPIGAWRIVSYRFVGVSALSPGEAGAWIGRLVLYAHAMAGLPPDTCAAPGYASSVVNVADVAADYHMRLRELGFPRARVQLIEVRCDNGWRGPGGRVYVLGANRLVTVWDGVFFDMARDTTI